MHAAIIMVNLALFQISSEITRLNCHLKVYTIGDDLFIKVSFMSNGVMSLKNKLRIRFKYVKHFNPSFLNNLLS